MTPMTSQRDIAITKMITKSDQNVTNAHNLELLATARQSESLNLLTLLEEEELLHPQPTWMTCYLCPAPSSASQRSQSSQHKQKSSKTWSQQCKQTLIHCGHCFTKQPQLQKFNPFTENCFSQSRLEKETEVKGKVLVITQPLQSNSVARSQLVMIHPHGEKPDTVARQHQQQLKIDLDLKALSKGVPDIYLEAEKTSRWKQLDSVTQPNPQNPKQVPEVLEQPKTMPHHQQLKIEPLPEPMTWTREVAASLPASALLTDRKGARPKVAPKPRLQLLHQSQNRAAPAPKNLMNFGPQRLPLPNSKKEAVEYDVPRPIIPIPMASLHASHQQTLCKNQAKCTQTTYATVPKRDELLIRGPLTGSSGSARIRGHLKSHREAHGRC